MSLGKVLPFIFEVSDYTPYSEVAVGLLLHCILSIYKLIERPTSESTWQLVIIKNVNLLMELHGRFSLHSNPKQKQP